MSTGVAATKLHTSTSVDAFRFIIRSINYKDVQKFGENHFLATYNWADIWNMEQCFNSFVHTSLSDLFIHSYGNVPVFKRVLNKFNIQIISNYYIACLLYNIMRHGTGKDVTETVVSKVSHETSRRRLSVV